MSVYYNEIDPYAAEWIRELIRADLIPAGEVDERSIEDIKPNELRGYAQCHFFAGIAGWAYALDLAGWPRDRPVWTGSCPCQPFSAAGKRAGFADQRHLWPAWFHLIRECKPAVVFGEQVASKDGLKWLDLVQADLEASGYSVGASDLCAAGVGAPHIRQRLWFVADADESSQHEWASGRQQPLRDQRIETGELLAHATDPRHERRRSCQASDGRDSAWIESQRFCAAGLVAENEGDGRRQGGALDRGSDEGGATQSWSGPLHRSSNGIALGDANDSGLEGRQFSGERSGELTTGAAGVDGVEYATREQTGVSGQSRIERVADSWRNPDWIACRDGKVRPVEPEAQCMAYGLSAAMVRLRSDEEKEVIDAQEANGFGDKVMRAMRSGHDPSEIWKAIGGRYGVPQATILLSVLCKQSWELDNFFNGQTPRGTQISRDSLQSLRKIWPTTGSSQGRKCAEQPADELGNSLRKMSQERSSFRELVGLLSSFNGHPLTHGATSRMVRLRGYGNAINPEVAAQFVLAYIEARGGMSVELAA